MTKDEALMLAMEAMEITGGFDVEINAIKEALAQRTWQGLTEEDFSAINQSCLTKLQAAASAESILKEKNNG